MDDMNPGLKIHSIFSENQESLSEVYELGQQLTTSQVSILQRLDALRGESSSRG